MNIDKNLKGKGINTSIKQTKVCKNVKHIFKEYNNTYRLNPDVDFESLDFIYNENSVNTTKFAIILLTEWTRYLKKGGKLILKFEENKLLNEKKLVRIYEQLLSKNMKILEKENSKKSVVYVFQKTSSQFIKNDSIDKWTFGIITVGKRNEWVRQYIKSIREQKIPKYEIIIVGTWNDPAVDKKDIRYISFNQKDNKGWITKKKNILYEHAKYNNVFILHDRFFLDKNWYTGIKKYGNSWDAIFFPIIDKNKKEYVHWSMWGHGFLPIGYADIRDWGEDYYCGGTFMAMKKHVWKEVKWNEKLYWCEQEDSEFGLRLTKKGFIMRANPYAKIHTLASHINDAPIYKYNNQKLGKCVEYRSKKWVIIQPIVDILTRITGTPFLRIRIAISRFLKKHTKIKVMGQDAGGKRD